MSTLISHAAPGARPFADYTGLNASEIHDRTRAARRRLGARAVVLGHHYQRESVMEFAEGQIVREREYFCEFPPA